MKDLREDSCALLRLPGPPEPLNSGLEESIFLISVSLPSNIERMRPYGIIRLMGNGLNLQVLGAWLGPGDM